MSSFTAQGRSGVRLALRARLVQSAPHPLASSLVAKRHASSIPTIASPAFWRSIMPKALRRERLPPDVAALKIKKPRSKEWNPATFFIMIFILIGSMSIQMITLKKDADAFTRQADVRVGLLREVVERIQRGENVDVEKALGTGNPEAEKEWEDALREIEREDLSRSRGRQEKKSPEPVSNKPIGDQSSSESTVKSNSTASFF